MEIDNIDILKKKILEQLKAQGFPNAALCAKLLNLALKQADADSVAMAHIWLAENLLHNERKIDCKRELEAAKPYLNQSIPNEILEKYYFVAYKLYIALYDTQTAFEYCLKSLNIAEQLYENPEMIQESHLCFINTVGNRVVGDYGNIGINFFNHGIYEKALLYCKKALSILQLLDVANVYAECLLRLNIIISLIRINTPQEILQQIQQLQKLPIEKQALKIYVDYAYVNYYIYMRDIPKTSFYVNELLNDNIEKYADRLTAIDFYLDILGPVIELKIKDAALLLHKEIQRIVHNDEIRPLMSLAKMKILFANTFNGNDSGRDLYKEYFELYLKS